ncbi:MAG TPA: hypothetical protein VK735_36145 [Pseudonocardia sp.]|jgi:hypothetical protein|uniref:hypothetical protein n=1 Tax=Pseudonocardia sp. TaxID=60912 RepID=UPI002CBB3789|nr:hypothetical protein [Pseudonocardia sp.]HTF52908.1 hypothetical protein [Pseudonocardia sp.]
MQSTEQVTSGELFGLVDQAQRLANAARRPDLLDRLGRVRARLAGREMHIVLVGAPGQGVTSLVRVLDQIRQDRLPGAHLVDAPGGRGADQIPVPDVTTAHAVLFASDASHEYGPLELDALARIRAQGAPVAGVITKIDLNSQWPEVQQANRERLREAKLDTPPIPLLPVSSVLSDSGRERNDESLTVASGIPQLVEFLRDRMSTRVDSGLRDAVLGEVRAVIDQLGTRWKGELDHLGSTGPNPMERQQRALAELERRQQLSVNWQLALADGATELMAQVEHDLRDRLRTVVRLAERDIGKSDPVPRWEQFDIWVRAQVGESVQANFQLTRERSRQLAERVGGQLAGNPDGRPAGVSLPHVRVNNPDEELARVQPMELPDSAKGGVLPRLINSLRGSYGGVLMVGVLTSLAGLVLINPWSIGAGVLLGAFTFWEDRKNGKERIKAEAKQAVSKLMDEVIFRVGDDSRTQLRRVHRTLRDHFTVLNDQRLRAASDAVRTASEATQLDAQHDSRVAELRANLAELGQLRNRLAAPVG